MTGDTKASPHEQDQSGSGVDVVTIHTRGFRQFYCRYLVTSATYIDLLVENREFFYTLPMFNAGKARMIGVRIVKKLVIKW